MAADSKPLLSICIPTYNRAHFLRVMLQALLPQVADCGSEVEIWVLNNASTDDTLKVIEDSKSLGPFQVKHQIENIGPVGNIVDGPQKLARGEYTWILGDHNLLRPNSLKYVLDKLRESRSFDVLYVNYRAASYPDQWPQEARRGYEGSFDYIGNPEIQDGPISHWYELLRPLSAACTQNYVHIVRTQIWQDFWRNVKIGAAYSSALTTYPHTITLIQTQLQSPAMVISNPCFTIFNGAQSWGNPKTKVKVYFVGLSELLKTLESKQLPKSVTKPLWNNFFYPESSNVACDALAKLGRIQGIILVITYLGLNPRSWIVFFWTLVRYFLPGLYYAKEKTRDYLINYRSWYLYNCRPARCLRRKMNLPG